MSNRLWTTSISWAWWLRDNPGSNPQRTLIRFKAAKAWSAGNRAGYNISKARAINWITSNPAKAAGIYYRTGSIVAGKDADLVLWSKNPFSVYALAEKVYIDGGLAFDREAGFYPVSDFDLGIIKPSGVRVE